MDRMVIGQAAAQAGLSAKAIRLYEKRGLLPAAVRSHAGYRTYGDNDVGVMRFIQQARALGMSLEEVGEILDLQHDGAQPCQTVVQLLDAHVRQIDRRVADLRALRKTLVAVRVSARERVADSKAAVCPIIEGAGRAAS